MEHDDKHFTYNPTIMEELAAEQAESDGEDDGQANAEEEKEEELVEHSDAKKPSKMAKLAPPTATNANANNSSIGSQTFNQ